MDELSNNIWAWLFIAILTSLSYRRFLSPPQNRGFWDYLMSTSIATVVTVVAFIALM